MYLVTGGSKGMVKLRSTYSLDVLWECGDLEKAPLPRWPGSASAATTNTTAGEAAGSPLSAINARLYDYVGAPLSAPSVAAGGGGTAGAGAGANASSSSAAVGGGAADEAAGRLSVAVADLLTADSAMAGLAAGASWVTPRLIGLELAPAAGPTVHGDPFMLQDRHHPHWQQQPQQKQQQQQQQQQPQQQQQHHHQQQQKERRFSKADDDAPASAAPSPAGAAAMVDYPPRRPASIRSLLFTQDEVRRCMRLCALIVQRVRMLLVVAMPGLPPRYLPPPAAHVYLVNGWTDRWAISTWLVWWVGRGHGAGEAKRAGARGDWENIPMYCIDRLVRDSCFSLGVAQMFMAVGLEDGRFAMYTPDKEYIIKRLQLKLAELGF